MSQTQERTYTNTTLDRSHWPAGPWDNEPDKIQWIDRNTGLDCLAVRNRFGAWCGYVGVSASHPWHGVGYGQCIESCGNPYCYEHTPENRIDVHGGITYASLCQDGPEDQVICHVPFDGRPDDVWWFGFDCAHFGDLIPFMAGTIINTGLYDGDVYRDLRYVRDQCADMAYQLAEVAK